MTITLEFAVGLSLALLLNLDFPLRTLFRTLVLLPLMVPPLVSGLLWRVMYDHQYGVLSFFIRALGTEPPVFLGDRLLALPAVVLTEAWRATPFMALVLLAALQAVPHELHEAAQVDGAGPVRRFWRVTLPLLSPTIFFAVVVGSIFAFQTFGQIDILTQGGPLKRTNVLTYFIVKTLQQDNNDGKAAVLAVGLFGITFLLTLVQMRVLERRVHYGR